jgi:cell division protein FtsI (penicillin-binding protein 3)
MDEPQYIVFVMLDEPQPTPETFGFATAGWNAVPAAGKIVQRIAPLLGVRPKLSPEDMVKLAQKAEPGTVGD